jgi:hypothetical protein
MGMTRSKRAGDERKADNDETRNALRSLDRQRGRLAAHRGAPRRGQPQTYYSGFGALSQSPQIAFVIFSPKILVEAPQ